ncbi:MAG: hypothetical protein HC933_16680 [Pleurocapsa sp. SU_196_0]|nr:hypothetical protein [Pleurocapsa sp. SU_196_0]
MNRVLPVVLIVIALGAAFLLSRPRPAPVTESNGTLEVPALTLEGTVATLESDLPVRVAAIAAGEVIADSGVVDGKYKLELPATVNLTLGSLEGISLLHGEGRLQGAARASEVTILTYQDANRDAKYELGEPKLEAALLPANSDPNLLAYFKYKVILLSGDANLQAQEDNPTGAKNFYRYDIRMNRGYNILQGEFASNGYEMKTTTGTNWDLLVPLPAGGNTSPPAFTP